MPEMVQNFIPVGASVLVAAENAAAISIQNDLFVEDGEAEGCVVGHLGRQVEWVPLLPPVVLLGGFLLRSPW